MNWKVFASLFVIFALVGLLMFSPKGKDFREEYMPEYFQKTGSFLRGMTSRVVKNNEPIISDYLKFSFSSLSPSLLKDAEFEIRGSDFEAELEYDLIELMDGNIDLDSSIAKIRMSDMIGEVSFYKNGKMKITGKASSVEFNGVCINKTDIDFLIVGDPVMYMLNDVEKDEMLFESVSGSLSWEGLNDISPLLEYDDLILFDFEGDVEKYENTTIISGSVSSIDLNGITIAKT